MFRFFFSWLATQFHLSSIIGAFTAGIIIHEGFFSRTETRAHRNGLSIQDLIAPLEATLVPLFFMLIGIQVKLETFFDWQVLQLSLVLIVAAVAGKLVSGLGATGNAKRFFIGIGMLPRGEVGLIFASIGQSIGVISTPLFSAVVLMVVVTTFLAPIWLKTQKNAISQS